MFLHTQTRRVPQDPIPGTLPPTGILSIPGVPPRGIPPPAVPHTALPLRTWLPARAGPGASNPNRTFPAVVAMETRAHGEPLPSGRALPRAPSPPCAQPGTEGENDRQGEHGCCGRGDRHRHPSAAESSVYLLTRPSGPRQPQKCSPVLAGGAVGAAAPSPSPRHWRVPGETANLGIPGAGGPTRVTGGAQTRRAALGRGGTAGSLPGEPEAPREGQSCPGVPRGPRPRLGRRCPCPGPSRAPLGPHRFSRPARGPAARQPGRHRAALCGRARGLGATLGGALRQCRRAGPWRRRIRQRRRPGAAARARRG